MANDIIDGEELAIHTVSTQAVAECDCPPFCQECGEGSLVVATSTVWKFANGAPPAGWHTAAFDDSSYGNAIVTGDNAIWYDGFSQRWIYTDPEVAAAAAFRTTFELNAVPASASLLFTLDNYGDVYINGSLVASRINAQWGSVGTFSVPTSVFEVGTNVMSIVAQSDGILPSGVYAVLTVNLPFSDASAIDLLAGTPRARIKVSSEESPSIHPREEAVDGDLDTVWDGTNATGVPDEYWAVDLSTARAARGFRLRTQAPAVANNFAEAVILYGTNDAAAWAWLVDGSPVPADPSANGWTAVSGYSGVTSQPVDESASFAPASFRYWLFRATEGAPPGASTDWDINEVELFACVPVLGPVAGGNVGSDISCMVHPDHQHDLQGWDEFPTTDASDTGTKIAALLAALQTPGQLRRQLGDGTNPLSAADRAWVRAPFAMVLTGWTVTGDVSGSIVIDVRVDTYGNFPPAAGDSIGTKPTLSSVQKNQGSWSSVSVPAGSVIGFNIDSVSSLSRVELHIDYTRAL